MKKIVIQNADKCRLWPLKNNLYKGEVLRDKDDISHQIFSQSLCFTKTSSIFSFKCRLRLLKAPFVINQLIDRGRDNIFRHLMQQNFLINFVFNKTNNLTK